MLATKKAINSKGNILKLHTNDLINYLRSYDITKEPFKYNITNDKELKLLSKYYDDKYNHAATLTAEDEFVGYTFDHLEEISKVLKRK